MSAPTDDHEFRVRTLDTAAVLAGFRRRSVWDGLRPDVCRLNEGGGLLLGDAKHTETPGNEATRWRWARYARRAHQLLAVGEIQHVSFVVCCPSQTLGWKRLISDVADLEGLRIASDGAAVWGEDLQVAWVVGRSQLHGRKMTEA